MSKITLEKEIWKPDRNIDIPLYKQIYDFFILKISNGEWSIGSKMPSQQAMAKKFGVNRSTIVEVYDELKSEGLIQSKTKSGTIIINNTWSILTSNAPLDWNKKISNSLHEPNLNIIQIINDVESSNDYIRLGAGELAKNMMPSKYLKDIFHKVADSITYMGYDDPKGLLELREEVVKYLAKKGIITDSSKILIVSGALQALNLISTGLLSQGATILTEKPSYLQSLTLFDSHYIDLNSVDTDKNGISIDKLTGKIATKKPELLYIIPNYQNPTGILTSDSRRTELLKLCEKERLAIIEDDVYGELWFDTPPPPPLKARDKNGNVVYIGSISKTLSAGMRVGWIVGNENVINRLADIKMQTDYGSSNISQWICTEFLRTGAYESFASEIRQELKYKRDRMLSILEMYFKDIATWNKPSGGLYIWLKLKTPIPQYKLFETCYKEKLVINPGYLYDDNDKSSLRLSFASLSLEELEEGLVALSNIIRTF